MLQKVFKDNKVLISERKDNNLFAVSIHVLWYLKLVLCGVPLQFVGSADCLKFHLFIKGKILSGDCAFNVRF